MKKDPFGRIKDLVSSAKDILTANTEIYELTGIRDFFLSLTEIDEFLAGGNDAPLGGDQAISGKEYASFQTSMDLASRVCSILLKDGFRPDIVIEPTSGEGNFLLSVLKTFREIQKVIGIEIQSRYVKHSKFTLLREFLEGAFERTHIEILHEDIFTHEFDPSLLDGQNRILIIGNPPWATNSDLEGKNLPKKSNFKGTNGLDAITGRANFDISEYIILHLLRKFAAGCEGKLAFLCKTQVVKNIVQFLPATVLPVSNCRMFLFEAKKEFDASVEACLFTADLNDHNQTYQCRVYDLEDPGTAISTFGWVANRFVSDVEKYKEHRVLDGRSPLVWRSGIKHDCSKVMELRVEDNNLLYNGLGEEVSIEPDLVFPLLKSSQIKGPVIKDTKRRIIVTQSKSGRDTSYIQKRYPLLWNYLASHRILFDKRKSIIYRNSPPFSVFGIGEYSFSPYKIVISGMYKNGEFSLAVPVDGRPVMLDDSCYLLGLNDEKYASILLALLNSELTQDFLKSIAFVDAKRPYTKEVLMRIDLLQVAENIKCKEVSDYLMANELCSISQEDYEKFRAYMTNERIDTKLP